MMNRLNLDPLSDAVNIVELATQFGAELKKSGRAWQSKCPFHNGDNPTAFTVWPETGTWKCYTGCNTGGDAIDLVQHAQGLEFIEAVKWLADWARVPLEKLNWSPEAIQEHQRQIAISELLTQAAKFYQSQLLADEAAAAYGPSRGFSMEHVTAVQWGYTRADDALLKAITHDASARLPLAREIGLIRADGKDFCANANGDTVSPEGWIVYAHLRGSKVAYLSARALNKTAKDKNRNLPGPRQIYRADTDLHLGENTLRLRDDGLVIVEGPADAESVRAWGWPAWAMCGAPIDEASNPHLMAALRKKAKHATIYVAMSHDSTGLRYADELAASLGPLTRIVLWPLRDEAAKKSDANECLQRGLDDDRCAELFEASETFLDRQIQKVSLLRDVSKKADGLDRLAGLVAQLSETERKIYISKIAEASLDISRREFSKMVTTRLKSDSPNAIEAIGGMLSFFGEPLINAVPCVEGELIIDDGLNAPTILYSISGKLANGNSLPTIEVAAEDFDSMKWIGKQWGARAYPLVGGGKTHLLKRAILESSLPTMKTDHVYTFTGFHTVNGARAFLSATGALNAGTLDEAARVDLPNNLAHYALPKPVTGVDLITAFQTSMEFLKIAPLTVTVPLWAVVFGAPLSVIKSLNAVLQVYGPTQSKKSTVTHLALTHFGENFVQGRDYKAPMDWTSTAADIEAKLFTCKDVSTIVDDYAPQFSSATESREIAKKAAYVIRSVGNRSSRGRRNADMSARMQYIPRGSVIMTAEQPLVGQSIVGRTVVIPIEYQSVDLNLLSAAQTAHSQYSMAMSGYIQWLIGQWDRVKTESEKLVQGWLASLNGAFPNQDRLTDYYAALRLGLHWGLRFGEEINALDDAENTEVALAVDLLTLLEGQSQRISDQSPVQKFFEAIDDLITGKQVHLLDRTQRNTLNNEVATSPEHGVQLIGWKVPEKNQVWLLTSQALIEVKEYWAGLDERYDTLLDALRREMWQYGFVPERDDRQLEVVRWINKVEGSKRVLVVDAAKVYERFKVDLIAFGPNEENVL
jgi:DNA primase catalytic core